VQQLSDDMENNEKKKLYKYRVPGTVYRVAAHHHYRYHTSSANYSIALCMQL
jgi:hypothetical protein